MKPTAPLGKKIYFTSIHHIRLYPVTFFKSLPKEGQERLHRLADSFTEKYITSQPLPILWTIPRNGHTHIHVECSLSKFRFLKHLPVFPVRRIFNATGRQVRVELAGFEELYVILAFSGVPIPIRFYFVN